FTILGCATLVPLICATPSRRLDSVAFCSASIWLSSNETMDCLALPPQVKRLLEPHAVPLHSTSLGVPRPSATASLQFVSYRLFGGTDHCTLKIVYGLLRSRARFSGKFGYDSVLEIIWEEQDYRGGRHGIKLRRWDYLRQSRN
ncbi:hypothetical protein C8F04DRAFT_1094118, partial [Mycena alexandri]